MPASIADAEARISKLQEEIKKYTNKIMICNKLQPAYENNRNRVNISYEDLDILTTIANTNIGEAADDGLKAFSKGLCYLEQEEGTSKDFDELGKKTEETGEVSQEAINARDELISKLDAVIAKIIEYRGNFKDAITNCEKEIASLRSWIAEEIRRQEEERAAEMDRNWVNQVN